MTGSKNNTQFQTNPHIGNIENFNSYSNVPTGIIVSLLVNGTEGLIETEIPLATTEGALVASYNRGCKAMNCVGGVSSYCIANGVQRVPLFQLDRVADAILFSKWIDEIQPAFSQLISKRSKHALLKECTPIIVGNVVNLELVYETGDASGQNMVTFCTDEICRFIVANTPVKIKKWYIEGNMSGDKKSSTQHLKSVRGRKVVADIVIPKQTVHEVLKTSPTAMVDYWQHSMVNAAMTGTAGAHGHLANGLTAIFIATGQDAACVAESSTGITRFDLTEEGALYASLTLPSLMIGTVGGGTKMPYAQDNLKLMDCLGAGKSERFAEIVGGLLLAGELSIAAAITANHFTSAHEKLGR